MTFDPLKENRLNQKWVTTPKNLIKKTFFWVFLTKTQVIRSFEIFEQNCTQILNKIKKLARLT